MKILYLCHRPPFPPNKGEKIRTFHQIEYLANKGHEITVFAPTSGEDDVKHLEELKKLHCSAVYHSPAPGLSAYFKALLFNKPVSVTHFYSSGLQSQLDQYLSEHRIDSIVCTASSMAEYVFKSKNLNKPQPSKPSLVMDFMDLDSDKWKQYQSLKGFPMNLVYAREAKLIGQYEKKIHSEFQASFFISEAEVDLFLETTPDLGKLHVIANGLDTTTFKPSTKPKPDNGPNLLFTGVMDYLPNEDAVIWFVKEGWKKIRSKHPNATFYIAGMNPSPQVQELEQFDGVVVTGFVEDIMEYYDKSHIFIAPFRLARGVQNKVLQAFSCGLPTISTSMGYEGINCEANTHALTADTIAAMLKAIDWVVENPEKAEKLGKTAHQLIEQEYTWESKLSQFEDIIFPNH